MDDPDLTQPAELNYRAPARKARLHPLVLVSLAASVSLAAILLVNIFDSRAPQAINVRNANTSCGVVFAVFAAMIASLLAMLAVKSHPEAWAGKRLALASLVAAVILFFLFVLAFAGAWGARP